MAWITGANGLIGNYLVQTAPRFAPRWQVRALTRKNFDLLDFVAVERAFKQDQPQLVIHCAAITVVGEAQKNPESARRVNVEVTQFLAELAAEIPLVFFSTDVVFDGRKGNYTEMDAPNPLHVYGETKAAAEEIVLKNPWHLVIRTSLNAVKSLTGDRAFNEQLHRSLQRASGISPEDQTILRGEGKMDLPAGSQQHVLPQAGQGMTLFTDEFRCPISAMETARAVWELVGKNRAGLYHVAGAEKLSRLQIGELLVQRWPEVTAQIKSGSAKDFAGPPRALDTSLDISKVQKILSQPLPKFSEWLAKNPDGI